MAKLDVIFGSFHTISPPDTLTPASIRIDFQFEPPYSGLSFRWHTHTHTQREKKKIAHFDASFWPDSMMNHRFFVMTPPTNLYWNKVAFDFDERQYHIFTPSDVVFCSPADTSQCISNYFKCKQFFWCNTYVLENYNHQVKLLVEKLGMPRLHYTLGSGYSRLFSIKNTNSRVKTKHRHTQNANHSVEFWVSVHTSRSIFMCCYMLVFSNLSPDLIPLECRQQQFAQQHKILLWINAAIVQQQVTMWNVHFQFNVWHTFGVRKRNA